MKAAVSPLKDEENLPQKHGLSSEQPACLKGYIKAVLRTILIL